MRYIDLTLILSRPGVTELIAEAQASRAAVNGANPGERDDLIKAGRQMWVRFRPVFEEVFGRKCWYTESRNPGTDDDVDHYRPKGRVAEAAGHGGYWWEALNWENFRLSCHRANRLRQNPETGETHGKGDHFPLLDEGARWMGPDELNRESPTLLDPTDPADPPLLTFDQDGRVAIAPSYAVDPDATIRVEQSRIYLHLDWPAFVEERRDLYAYIYKRVLDGDRAEEAASSGDMGARDALKAVARDLIHASRDSEPYSRAAASFVRRFRDRPWIERAVLPHLPAID